MKNWIWGALLILAFLLNPSEERHARKIYKEIDRVGLNNQFGALGGWVDSMAGVMMLADTTYHSWIIFSYTRCRGQTMTFGFMGFVFG